jgi:hypothetical protein
MNKRAVMARLERLRLQREGAFPQLWIYAEDDDVDSVRRYKRGGVIVRLFFFFPIQKYFGNGIGLDVVTVDQYNNN